MPLSYPDMVAETSVTTGTNDFELAGALAGYRAFSDALTDGDFVPYNAFYAPASEFESGVGMWVESTGRLERTHVLQSSNNNNKVSFSMGTKRISIGLLGSLAKPSVDTLSTDHTVTPDDHGRTLVVDATGGARTVTLPAAATVGTGFRISVKKSDTGANTVTIDGNGSETIDGATTLVLHGIRQGCMLVCDGTGWRTFGDGIDSGSNAGGRYIRFPDRTQICIPSGLLTASAGGFVTWTLPASFSGTDYQVLLTSNVGSAVVRDASYAFKTTSDVQFQAIDSGNARTGVNLSAVAIGTY